MANVRFPAISELLTKNELSLPERVVMRFQEMIDLLNPRDVRDQLRSVPVYRAALKEALWLKTTKRH
jgi:hypothetical protein